MRCTAYEKTVQFATAIEGSPHLALLVQNLDVRLPSKDLKDVYETDAKQDGVISALCKLDAISSLTISPSPLKGSTQANRVFYHSSMPKLLQDLFVTLVRGPQLCRLAVIEIVSFPPSLILRVPQLEILEIIDGTTRSQ